MSGPEDPGLSFIFIVNEVVANDDPDTHGVLPRTENGGRWAPPIYAQGFYRQTEGKVYRWKNGDVTRLENYRWHAMYIEPTETDEAANGVVMDPYARPLTRYRSATVFYANPFTKFRSAPGDATARNLYDQGEIWHNLRFHHTGPNISLVDHAGEEDYLIGNNTRCSWHKQLVPQAYECQENNEESGGLAGLLPILIALVAFSCKTSELDDVLRRGRSWRNRNWVRHSYSNGSESSISHPFPINR